MCVGVIFNKDFIICFSLFKASCEQSFRGEEKEAMPHSHKAKSQPIELLVPVIQKVDSQGSYKKLPPFSRTFQGPHETFRDNLLGI